MGCVALYFNDTATTEIYTHSLHDALPICVDDGDRMMVGGAVPRRPRGVPGCIGGEDEGSGEPGGQAEPVGRRAVHVDRKSTRLNSSHANISYAVFCLKKNITTISVSIQHR